MRRAVTIFVWAFFLVVLSQESLYAWFWGDSTLVTVNGEKYTSRDFANWWQNWKEEGISFPDTPDSFIDWHLLAREAEQMELYNEPSYRHKIDVFLKARALLMYQGEKIGARLDISESDLKNQYEAKYLPRILLHILYFNDKEKAEAAYRTLSSEQIDFPSFAQQALEGDAKSVFFEEKWTRHAKLNQEWLSVVSKLHPGETAEPFAWSKGYVILRLQEEKGGDDEDFEYFRETVSRELRKIREAQLTFELVEELKKKYKVTVDQQLFDAIDPFGTNEKILDEPFITMDDTVYSVGIFLQHLQKDTKFRSKYGYDVAEADALKKKALNGVLAQTLTTRGAVDEHYEEKEPLKPLYQFYTKHRLIKELEKRLFRPKVIVSEEEIKTYYEDNPEKFSRPATVSLAVLEDEEKLIAKIHRELIGGGNFEEVATTYYSAGAPVRQMEYKSLHPEVKAVLDGMVAGDVSEPFLVNGHHTIIKLVKRVETVPFPFDHAREQIVGLLDREKYEKVRNAYLAALRANSVISVNGDVWQKIRKEYGDAEKEN